MTVSSILSLAARRAPVLVAVLLLALAGCGRDPLPPDVVATVNGRPIGVGLLQTAHDVRTQSWTNAQGPSVEELKAQYGAVLAELIVQELVMQHLQREGVPVTDSELAAAEDEVRADYPAGEFEASLIEEYMDVAVWREMLRRRLALRKFADRVLRPEITVTLAEVTDWYRAHEGEFRLPARVRFIMYEGFDKEEVEKALRLYDSGASPAEVEKAMPGVTVSELLVRRDRLPVAWQKELSALAPRKASAVRAQEGRNIAFLLLDNLPPRVLSLTEAYPVIERRLVEQKLDAAFDAWAEKALRTADVKVSAHLAGAGGNAGAGREASPQNDSSRKK